MRRQENIPYDEMTEAEKSAWRLGADHVAKEQERIDAHNNSMLKAGGIFLVWLFAGNIALTLAPSVITFILYILVSPILCGIWHGRWTQS